MFLTSKIYVIQDQREKKNTFTQKKEKYTYIYVYMIYTL